jgi:uncharacterized protein with PQ loop repeat
VSTHMLALSFGYLGAALGVVMVVPQIVRIVRHPRLAGVSVVTWSVTVVTCLLWLSYGARTGQLPQIPGNVLLIAGAVTIVLIVPSARSRTWRAIVLGSVTAVAVGVSFALPAHDGGYLAFSIGLFASLPQLADTVRTWRMGATSAVSVSSWSLKIASQTAWLLYGIGVSDRPVLISACVTLSTATLLVFLEMNARSSVMSPAELAPEFVH